MPIDMVKLYTNRCTLSVYNKYCAMQYEANTNDLAMLKHWYVKLFISSSYSHPVSYINTHLLKEIDAEVEETYQNQLW